VIGQGGAPRATCKETQAELWAAVWRRRRAEAKESRTKPGLYHIMGPSPRSPLERREDRTPHCAGPSSRLNSGFPRRWREPAARPADDHHDRGYCLSVLLFRCFGVGPWFKFRARVRRTSPSCRSAIYGVEGACRPRGPESLTAAGWMGPGPRDAFRRAGRLGACCSPSWAHPEPTGDSTVDLPIALLITGADPVSLTFDDRYDAHQVRRGAARNPEEGDPRPLEGRSRKFDPWALLIHPRPPDFSRAPALGNAVETGPMLTSSPSSPARADDPLHRPGGPKRPVTRALGRLEAASSATTRIRTPGGLPLYMSDDPFEAAKDPRTGPKSNREARRRGDFFEMFRWRVLSLPCFVMWVRWAGGPLFRRVDPVAPARRRRGHDGRPLPFPLAPGQPAAEGDRSGGKIPDDLGLLSAGPPPPAQTWRSMGIHRVAAEAVQLMHGRSRTGRRRCLWSVVCSWPAVWSGPFSFHSKRSLPSLAWLLGAVRGAPSSKEGPVLPDGRSFFLLDDDPFHLPLTAGSRSGTQPVFSTSLVPVPRGVWPLLMAGADDGPRWDKVTAGLLTFFSPCLAAGPVLLQLGLGPALGRIEQFSTPVKKWLFREAERPSTWGLWLRAAVFGEKRGAGRAPGPGPFFFFAFRPASLGLR